MIKRGKSNEDLVENLHISVKKKDVTYYYYLHPITKKRTSMGNNRKIAIEAATYLNGLLTKKAPLIQRVMNPKKKTVLEVINEYKKEIFPNKPLADRTKDNYRYRINLFAESMGNKMIESVDRVIIANWLKSYAVSNDVYNTALFLIKDIFDYAVSRKYIDTNEAALVLKKSKSKKLEANKKTRQRLTVEQFWAIHEQAPPWLQNAMELSLVTLQARQELVNIEYSHHREGWLYIIRQKVAGESDYGFIRIKTTKQIDDIIKRSRDKIVCPYFLHYNPKRIRRDQMNSKKHWACITTGYLSSEFKKARDKTKLFDGWEKGAAPTFHEIRSLGARIYREQGQHKNYIQSLLTHSDQKTTQIYLDGGDLTDEHFYKVEAGLDLMSLPNI